jgi:hypothetical protein
MLPLENDPDDRTLSRNVRFRHLRWWRDDGFMSALLLSVVSVMALLSGICLVLFSYRVLVLGN